MYRCESLPTELFSSRDTSGCRRVEAAAMAVAVTEEVETEAEMQVAVATEEVAVM